MASESPAESRKKLEAAKKELAANLAKKKKLDRDLATLETNLFHFETSYLTDSSSITFGNIVKGYEAYVKAPPSTNVSDRRKKTGAGAGGNEISEGERVFSKSSGTYQKALELKQKEAESATSEQESVAPDAHANKRRKHN